MAPSVPSVHDQIAQGLRDHPAKKGLPFNILVTILEVGGSITLFHVARRMGATDVASYLVGSIAPVLGGVAIWLRARKFSGASAAIFAFTFISAGIALVGSTAPKVLLYKDCAATALIGLVFLGSCVMTRKPLVFYMAQRYGTDGTHEGMSTFDTMWGAYPDFRRGMYVTSYLWAALFLIQGNCSPPAALEEPAGRVRGECGEAVRGVDWQRAGQPLSAIGGIHGSATMRRWSAPSGLTPFFITVAR